MATKPRAPTGPHEYKTGHPAERELLVSSAHALYELCVGAIGPDSPPEFVYAVSRLGKVLDKNNKAESETHIIDQTHDPVERIEVDKQKVRLTTGVDVIARKMRDRKS